IGFGEPLGGIGSYRRLHWGPSGIPSKLKANRLATGPATIEFYAVSNRTYSVQFRDALATGSWARLADIVARTPNRVAFVTDPAAQPRRFYRLVNAATAVTNSLEDHIP